MKHSLIIYLLLLIPITTTAYGYLGNTHQMMTGTVIQEKTSFLDKEIKKVGFDFGVKEIFKNSSVPFLILKGSKAEDDGTRARNHFYNPLNGSGLNDIFTGYSSYVWANELNSGWSWRNARDNFYLGLTASSDAEQRSALADSFRALGQVMHLLQDLAVPAHVRNDAHLPPFGDGLETYASQNVNKLIFSPIRFSGQKYSLSSYTPRQYWDSDQYDGTNPSTSTARGLAEYTNANFASEDTIFTENNLTDWDSLNDNHFFPYPRRQDTVVFSEDRNKTWNGFEVYRKYFEKVSGGEHVKHFATASRLYAYLLDSPDPSLQGLDDRCYKDYADLLIPHAVGYSAALIDYFFRGQLEVKGEEITNSTGDIEGLKAQVLNTTPEEAIENGDFVISYRYKPEGSAEYVFGLSEPVSSGTLEPAPAGCAQSYSFQFPGPIPAVATEKRYTIVFKGTLGQEAEAVVGRVVEMAPVGFSEEWDTGLQGHHYWLSTDSEIIGQNTNNGTVINEVSEGKLIKENIRFVGTTDGHVNQTYIGKSFPISSDQFCIDEWGYFCVPNDFGVEFPLPITPCTEVRVKIDEMSTTEEPGNSECTQPGSFQGLIMSFDNGINLALTVPGQEPWIKTYYSYIQPGSEISFNIFDAFAAAGVDFVEPVNLLSVDITQQMWTLCEPSTTEHRQRMVIDYLRVE